jgi:hypothetical protein
VLPMCAPQGVKATWRTWMSNFESGRAGMPPTRLCAAAPLPGVHRGNLKVRGVDCRHRVLTTENAMRHAWGSHDGMPRSEYARGYRGIGHGLVHGRVAC